jgi:hypothetical protein
MIVPRSYPELSTRTFCECVRVGGQGITRVARLRKLEKSADIASTFNGVGMMDERYRRSEVMLRW